MRNIQFAAPNFKRSFQNPNEGIQLEVQAVGNRLIFTAKYDGQTYISDLQRQSNSDQRKINSLLSKQELIVQSKSKQVIEIILGSYNLRLENIQQDIIDQGMDQNQSNKNGNIDKQKNFHFSIEEAFKSFSQKIENSVIDLRNDLAKMAERINIIEQNQRKIGVQIQNMATIVNQLQQTQNQLNLDQSLLKASLFKQQISFGNIHQYSKIIHTVNQTRMIDQQFFADHIIQNVRLLYRASQNRFSAKIFHDQCDGSPNTLVLCRTQYNKIIGGFTPLKWDSSGQYKNDRLRQSFLFSITDGQKCPLKTQNDIFSLKTSNKNKAIYCDKGYGACFGHSRDLYISDQADKNADSCCVIISSYQNENYRKIALNQRYQRFCGSRNGNKFKVLEWQVWQLQFNKDSKINPNDEAKADI